MRALWEPETRALTISAVGDLDVDVRDRFAREVANALQWWSPRRCLIDIRNLTFIDGAGVECLIDLRERVTHMGIDLRLVGEDAKAQRISALTGIAGETQAALPPRSVTLPAPLPDEATASRSFSRAAKNKKP
jgi:anti-anti-sigma factor